MGREILSGNTYGLEHMLGSGRVNFVKTDKDIIVTIFNVTNITSGAFCKDIGACEPPMSAVRWDTQLTQYGNVSQTFHFTIPLVEGMKQVRSTKIENR